MALPFALLAKIILEDLATDRSVAITGLSNTGKSTLMRALASAAGETAIKKLSGQETSLVYVDCNRAVAISARAFYEVVLRSLLEGLNDNLSEDLENKLRDHHRDVTEADSAFSASLSFNLALTELCEQLGRNLSLILDEFDEIYAALDDRALLNLRALRDRFRDRLTFVSATVRNLPTIRGRTIEGEFAELFSHSTYTMHPLSPQEAQDMLDELDLSDLDVHRNAECVELAGKHPGLLISTAQVIGKLSKDWEGDFLDAVMREAQPRAECFKIWEQLTKIEHAALISLALNVKEGLSPQRRAELVQLGIVNGDGFISPVFEYFVARRGRGSEIDTRGVFLDIDSGDVWVGGLQIPVLTDLEFRLISLLYERRDKITNKFRIVTTVWGESYLGEVDDARVEKLVSRLRSKIEPHPSNPIYLVTQRGRGYKLISNPHSSDGV
ncbi:MAG: winged helix-turn-helix domain-containing protein [Chloroflexi bacterium]|nr:winged helix-turn-helix domain-containing protein [Chloroflexota bacterium]